MKTMFYSEILNQYFETKDACRKAEIQYQLDKQAKEKAAAEAENKKKEEIAQVSKEKKELSKAIEAAETKVNAAYHTLELKQEEVKKLTEDYNQAVKALLTPARDAIKKAEQERYEAISAYNNKYGTYSVVYTGDRAFDEFKRFVSLADRVFDGFKLF